MARHGENIYLRKDGRWEGRYIRGRKADGRPLFGYIYARKYNEVRKKLIQKKAEFCVSDGELTLLYQSGSMDDWMNSWLEKVRHTVKVSTWHSYRRIIENHLSPALGQNALRCISSNDIQDVVNQLSQTLAAGTLHNVARLLRAILKQAEFNRLISQNPYVNIRLPRNKGKKVRVLTRKEQQQIEQAAIENGNLEYILCLYTGLRLGELCALRWADIDLEEGVINVSWTLQRTSGGTGESKTRLTLDTPKTENSVREIPLPDFLLKQLAEQKRKQMRQSCDFVFAKKNSSGLPQDPRTVQARFVRLARSQGIQGVHMHSLRHTYATRCLESAVRIETLSMLLGHSSPEITLKFYTHSTCEAKKKSAGQLAKGCGWKRTA